MLTFVADERGADLGNETERYWYSETHRNFGTRKGQP
jgi:hypothetical protein